MPQIRRFLRTEGDLRNQAATFALDFVQDFPGYLPDRPSLQHDWDALGCPADFDSFARMVEEEIQGLQPQALLRSLSFPRSPSRLVPSAC